MPLLAFHPAVRAWFASAIGSPTPAQALGWPRIRAGEHVLIAAPTGSGKTLAAFLHALDAMLSSPPGDATQVLYVSPLRALSHDVHKNLLEPLRGIRALDPTLPELRILVRTGDTPARERTAMVRRPPHVLVTTPESLFILLATERGRALLRTVRQVIVDEIHALVPSKRGSHLLLSLERLEALAGPLQRIGLSATQRPIDAVARFLCGVGRECAVVDVGHRRPLELTLELPALPLGAVCSSEQWDDIYARIVAQIEQHKTTLVFTNTRKLCERTAAQLQAKLGKELVTSHHGSLSRARRLDAEQRLKAGSLRALVATSSLELGIDIGDVDLVVQLGTTRSIATLLQRVGRAGHGPGRVPKGRLYPMTIDELLHGAALLVAVRDGRLDAVTALPAPLDILCQQLIAAAALETWEPAALFALVRRAASYADLSREQFDAVVRVASAGRLAPLHHDPVANRLRGTRRARLLAVTSGGAIVDRAQYQVVLDPDGEVVGAVDEDFATEASVGDVFQLGTASWCIKKIERGQLRVTDARGAPPSLPFWFGEAPSRTGELTAAVATVRARGQDEAWLAGIGLPADAARQLAAWLQAGARALGAMPAPDLLVAERFFDEAGGMQLVLHSPLGSRINKALGYALRKRFCRGFGFELQGAADEDAVLLSLGPMHSFALEEVFDYLQPQTARDLLVQAVLQAPMFQLRWRQNAQRALLVERMHGGRRVPPPLLRMRADDLLAQAFPQALACAETLPGGDLPLPDHPLVQQTLDDCLHELMDADGFLLLLQGLRAGHVRRLAVESTEPSVFSRGILNARPYAFLDPGEILERRAQAAPRERPGFEPDVAQSLDQGAVDSVCAEARPDPRDAEELHETLQWCGCLEPSEAAPWLPWLTALAAQGRARQVDGRWFATGAPDDRKSVLRGRLEWVGPTGFLFDPADAIAFAELEAEGFALRVQLHDRAGWCSRRLLQRIHRVTRERRRPRVQALTAAEHGQFVLAWQGARPGRQRLGPEGTFETIRQLAGLETTALHWERVLLPARVADYRRAYSDQLCFEGRILWCRLWGDSDLPSRKTPIALLPREDAEFWLSLAPPADAGRLSHRAAALHDLLQTRGPQFLQDLRLRARLLPSEVETGLAELIAKGLVTCDSLTALRQLLVPASRRRQPLQAPGRWSLLARGAGSPATGPTAPPGTPHAPPLADRLRAEQVAERVARQFLMRYGILFRAATQQEKVPVPWREIWRALRRLELAGDCVGGRFVTGFDGEQFALPAAVELMARRDAWVAPGVPESPRVSSQA
jgi:ATP-dependent Lhr-like helicase